MPGKYKNADAFVKARVSPAMRPVIKAVREAMRAAAPKAEEVVNWNMPMWLANHYWAFVSAVKTDVKLAFVDGTQFEDRYGLLKGKGSRARHVSFKAAADVKKTLVRYYVRQALKHDAAREPLKSRPANKKKK
jgi:hypothetical protein